MSGAAAAVAAGWAIVAGFASHRPKHYDYWGRRVGWKRLAPALIAQAVLYGASGVAAAVLTAVHPLDSPPAGWGVAYGTLPHMLARIPPVWREGWRRERYGRDATAPGTRVIGYAAEMLDDWAADHARAQIRDLGTDDPTVLIPIAWWCFSDHFSADSHLREGEVEEQRKLLETARGQVESGDDVAQGANALYGAIIGFTRRYHLGRYMDINP
jgi:hypothetical protein